ncbi:Mediator of RNA polymerase II transcription subunit 25 [Gossypium australe]|uniref:Mediator of RNA polymerase II transcription subunit 25 n=1 Tax=Gossypium australe TaxID=47621 RepID=A0A5B6VU45_9ROSI|nr:Mediator of RNA polymerase II transcription subunit 25 [Gossypium australe]
MRIVSWNIRGMGSEAKISSVRRVLCKARANMCFIQKMKAFGGVVTIWDRGSFQVDKDLCEERFIVVKGKWLAKGMEVVLINKQKILWANLLALKNSFACSWIISGDFNVVRNRSERSNCVGLMNGSKEFNSFINNYKMVDLPLMGKNLLGTILTIRGADWINFCWRNNGRYVSKTSCSRV